MMKLWKCDGTVAVGVEDDLIANPFVVGADAVDDFGTSVRLAVLIAG